MEKLINNKSSRYKVGDNVRYNKPKKDQKGLIGTVKEVERIFIAIDANGHFIKNGFRVGESTIPNTKLPYTFENDTLTLNFPNKSYTLKPYEFSYMVEFQGDPIWRGLLSRHIQKTKTGTITPTNNRTNILTICWFNNPYQYINNLLV